MIEELTVEQKAALAVKRDEWLAVGLSTDPADRGEAERGVREAYGAAGLVPPELIIWLRSPLEGAVCAGMVRDQVGAPVRAQVWAQVGAQVRDQVWAQVGDQVWAQVRDQVGAQVRAQVGDVVHGQHGSGWLSYYDYFAPYLNCVEPLSGVSLVARNAGWWWPFQNLAIITERPEELHRDPEHRLHNENGMAIRYSDGWGVWAINGVRVDERIVMRPETLTVEEITNEENAEVRRVMRQQYGYDKYLKGVNATLVDDDPEWGKLWRAEIKTEEEPLCLVEVVNSTPEPDGSWKTYFLRVPPDKTTAHDAIAWTFTDDEGEALTADTYTPLVQT